MSVLWPAFLTACAAEFLFFAMFDPHELRVFGGEPIPLSQMAIYTLGFFLFWAVTACSSWLTYLLSRSAAEINQ